MIPEAPAKLEQNGASEKRSRIKCPESRFARGLNPREMPLKASEITSSPITPRFRTGLRVPRSSKKALGLFARTPEPLKDPRALGKLMKTQNSSKLRLQVQRLRRLPQFEARITKLRSLKSSDVQRTPVKREKP
jgi:hypothetical protein